MLLKRRLKRTTKQYIIVAAICIVVIGGAAAITAFLLTKQIQEEYETLLTEAHLEMKNNKRNVYVAIADIMAGDCITKELIEKREVYATQPQETYLGDEDFGKTVIVDIITGTQILDNMVTDTIIDSEVRETEYNVLLVNSNIIENDTVDVRIIYPNGENYVVLSKKTIKGLLPETASLFLWLSEEELLRMSAAIVDAALYSGTKLYTTKYIEPNIQEASIVTYTPSLELLSLLESDPNIIERCSQELSREVRKALENRLADKIGADVTQINWDIPQGSVPFIVVKEDVKDSINDDTNSQSAEPDPLNNIQKEENIQTDENIRTDGYEEKPENEAIDTQNGSEITEPAYELGNSKDNLPKINDQDMETDSYFLYAQEAIDVEDFEHGQ